MSYTHNKTITDRGPIHIYSSAPSTTPAIVLSTLSDRHWHFWSIIFVGCFLCLSCRFNIPRTCPTDKWWDRDTSLICNINQAVRVLPLPLVPTKWACQSLWWCMNVIMGICEHCFVIEQRSRPEERLRSMCGFFSFLKFKFCVCIPPLYSVLCCQLRVNWFQANLSSSVLDKQIQNPVDFYCDA